MIYTDATDQVLAVLDDFKIAAFENDEQFDRAIFVSDGRHHDSRKGANDVNTTHTRGPWSVGEPTGLVNQISIQPCIGVVYGAGDEIKANAALISAAPDMYEALRLALGEIRECDDTSGVLAKITAALAKAGGQ